MLHEIIWLVRLSHVILNSHGLHTSVWFSVMLCKTHNFACFEVQLGQFYIAQEMIHLKIISTFMQALQCWLYPARLLLDSSLAWFASVTLSKPSHSSGGCKSPELSATCFTKEAFSPAQAVSARRQRQRPIRSGAPRQSPAATDPQLPRITPHPRSTHKPLGQKTTSYFLLIVALPIKIQKTVKTNMM